jgi:hypothetical protein
VAQQRMESQRAHEIAASDSNLEAIPPQILQLGGLDVHLPTAKAKIMYVKWKQQRNDRDKPDLCPIVDPFNLQSHQVKARTGFRNVEGLLSMILIVCDGDLTIMQKRESYLTWYEEWFMFFEFLWGKTTPTLFCGSISVWEECHSTTYHRCKMQMVLDARKRWPQFVSATTANNVEVRM